MKVRRIKLGGAVEFDINGGQVVLYNGGLGRYMNCAPLLPLLTSNCIRILSPHLRWGTRWSRSFA